ncbi:ATP-dependent DNA helicase [Aphelenchoides bicaudatus]|nr:ATP-dependent DNA helicase [Aphelenchoides bicaudatus]
MRKMTINEDKIETIKFGRFTFFKPFQISPPISTFRCCNGIHKGIGCGEERITLYTESGFESVVAPKVPPSLRELFSQSAPISSPQVATSFQCFKAPEPRQTTVNLNGVPNVKNQISTPPQQVNCKVQTSVNQIVQRSKNSVTPVQQVPLSRQLSEACPNTRKVSKIATTSTTPLTTFPITKLNNTTATFNKQIKTEPNPYDSVKKRPRSDMFQASPLTDLTNKAVPQINNNSWSEKTTVSNQQIPLKRTKTEPIPSLLLSNRSKSDSFTGNVSFCNQNVTTPSKSTITYTPGNCRSGNTTFRVIPPTKPFTINLQHPLSNSTIPTSKTIKIEPKFVVSPPPTCQIKQEPESCRFLATRQIKTEKRTGRTDMHGRFRSFLQDDTEQYNDDSQLEKVMRVRMNGLLKSVFGFNQFRFCQRSVIIALLMGRDCCVLMPTGAGKSLCYQLTALMSAGLTIVISPLRSLMIDQIAKLRFKKIACACLKGDTTKEERDEIFRDLYQQKPLTKLLYISPEMVNASMKLRNVLTRLHSKGLISRIVVDEAHCISSWGHDFRPDYKTMSTFFQQFQKPKVPIIALTATATPRAVIDIRKNLNIEDSCMFISSFIRPNLQCDLVQKSAANFRKYIKLLQEKFPRGTGIIYCLSRNDCETIADQLKSTGIMAAPYHSELGDKLREETQQKWMSNQIQIVCATNAFGLGIDKPDVRFVVHHSMPSSLEAYYQETGRAGRDGLPSICALMYAFSDHARLLKLFRSDGNSGSAAYKTHQLQSMYQMLAYCENVTVCRRKLLVEHFGEFYDAQHCIQSQTPCDICAELLQNDQPPFKAYEFTAEAVIVLQSMLQMKDTTVANVADLYRGVMNRKRNIRKSSAEATLPLFNRGEGCCEDDANRFIRKLLIEGLLEERLEFNKFANTDLCYVDVSVAGRQFIVKREPKIYSYMGVNKKKKANMKSRLYMMSAVSEAIVLKEKYKLKNVHLFRQARQEIMRLMETTARNQCLPSAYHVLSSDGIDQLAATLPRTNSELLQIDSMTEETFKNIGSLIMVILKKYWKQMDDVEHAKIREIVDCF